MLRLTDDSKFNYNFYLDGPRLIENYEMYLKRRSKYSNYLNHIIFFFILPVLLGNCLYSIYAYCELVINLFRFIYDYSTLFRA